MADNEYEEVEVESGGYELAEEPAPASTAAAAAPAGPVCAVCRAPAVGQYYVLGPTKAIVCDSCKSRDAGVSPGGSGFVRFLKATGLGIGLGLVGAAIEFGIRRATNREFGYVALVVGLLVGFGVKKGSEKRGGRGYQFLAIALTYLAVSISYIPDVYSGIMEEAHKRQTSNQPGNPQLDPGVETVLAVVLTCPISLAAPLLSGFESPILLLILGIAPWEAWKINRVAKSPYMGPFTTAGP